MTPGGIAMSGGTMSNETKIRHVRIPDELWLAAVRKAEAEGMSVSELVRHLMRRYVED